MPSRHRRPPSEASADPPLLTAIRELCHPLRDPAHLDPLLDRIGDARYVLLGEASHGTHEYYTWRTAISHRLITERGFSFIAVEGDWPDCYRVNRYVKGYRDAGDTAREVLHAFERWPTWMWANEEVVELAEWLRETNDTRPDRKVGFYGLDVYSLWDSLYQVLGYLRKHAPDALPAARRAFQCFEPYGEDVQDYARATRLVDASCEAEVIGMLAAVLRAAPAHPDDGSETHFNAEQNAQVVKNAESYYRAMVQGGPESWNVRDRHMAETLDRLMRQHGPAAKAIVWAHNTHVGDARYTDMAGDDMVNLGQLVRESHAPEGVVLVGFGSHRGSVIAGEEWDAPMERIAVSPGRPGSWEDLLHQAAAGDRLLLLDGARANEALLRERGHRAIGVVYRPQFERYGNYVPTVLPRRYDAFLFLDETQAVRPLHEVTAREEAEVPDTFPSGV
ncbi:MAG: erythromycin esterase family protein [Gemmataceae bacterium]